MQSILLVDDRPPVLAEFVAALKNRLDPNEAEVREWLPVEGENPVEAFNSRVDGEPALVVTDQDLTIGTGGLFGSIIINWCQAGAIPVGDYSSRPGDLPKEHDRSRRRMPETRFTPHIL